MQSSRKLGACTVIVALPVLSRDAHANLSEEDDRIICINIPVPFRAVGDWYLNFHQTTDAEVCELLSRRLADG